MPASNDDDEFEGVSALELGADLEDPLEELDGEDQSISFTEDDGPIARAQVRRAVRRFGGDGITVRELVEVTGFSKETVRKHLETLRRLREVYRIKRDEQMYMYYPNGKPLRSYGKKRIAHDDEDTTLEIQLAKGPNDDLFFHLTEKRYSLMEGETTEGAIIFPLSYLDEVFQELEDFAREVEQE